MSRTMTEPRGDRRGIWDYIEYRGDLLAQLALSRLPGVDVFQPQAEGGWDYLVATADGVAFAVFVRAYSSINRGDEGVATEPERAFKVNRAVVDRARRSRTPVYLFLFDADTEHGRFLRLDSLPPPRAEARHVTVHLPVANTIDGPSLAGLLADLQRG